MLVIEHACNLVCVHMHNAKKNNNVVVNSHNEKNVIGDYKNQHNTTGTSHVIIYLE